jgi:hypothetical protein
MTNQQALIDALLDKFDDGGASREVVVHYHINCPYVDGDPRCLCCGELEPQRRLCVDCKELWLASEVDE